MQDYTEYTYYTFCVPGTVFREQSSGNSVPGTVFREQCSGNSVPGTVFREQCSGNSVPGTVSREQCSGNRVSGTFEKPPPPFLITDSFLSSQTSKWTNSFCIQSGLSMRRSGVPTWLCSDEFFFYSLFWAARKLRSRKKILKCFCHFYTSKHYEEFQCD